MAGRALSLSDVRRRSLVQRQEDERVRRTSRISAESDVRVKLFGALSALVRVTVEFRLVRTCFTAVDKSGCECYYVCYRVRLLIRSVEDFSLRTRHAW